MLILSKLFLLLCVAAPGSRSGDSPIVRFRSVSAGLPLQVISVNLADPRVRIAVQAANGCPQGSESFESMVKRSGAVAAINGAYFTPPDGPPIGDIVCGGRLIHRGMMGTALAVTKENEAIIRRVVKDHAEDW